GDCVQSRWEQAAVRERQDSHSEHREQDQDLGEGAHGTARGARLRTAAQHPYAGRHHTPAPPRPAPAPAGPGREDVEMKLYEAETSGRSRMSGRWVLDALLVSLCVCLLLVLGVMLQRGTRPPSSPPPSSDTPDVPPPEAPPAPGPSPTFNPADLPDAAAEDEAPRARLMSLGFALLLVSLGVCLYTMYRLGFCCRRREYNRGRLRSGIPSVNSRLHLISATDLPPTYDAIMLSPRRPGPGDLDLQPPPYFTIITFQADKVPPPSYPAPSPRGMHGTSPGPATGAEAGRPQEAG
ncbi:Endosialin, partial [Frankliniella fusca]